MEGHSPETFFTDMETFPNAPITEALLEIQYTTPPEIGLPQLLEFHGLVTEKFPIKEEQTVLKQQITLKPGQAPESSAFGETIGYFFLQPDRTKIVHVGLTSFSFHKLKPYERWEVFRDEAKDNWEKFRSHIAPLNITRVGLRYINRIEVPLPMKDFRDYCLLFPEIPAKLPQALNELLLRFVLPTPDGRTMGAVTVTFEPLLPGASNVALILDIDVFEPFPFTTNDDIWEKFERLRVYKNQIFRYSLTEEAKKLFR